MDESRPAKARREESALDMCADSTLSADFEPGQLVEGRYLIQSVLGRGGMGIVYKAEQVFLKQLMALKTLDPHRMNTVSWQRLQKEAKAASLLDHPNLVKVYDFGLLPDDRPFFAMQYVDGISIADYLRDHGPMPIAKALSLFIQVAFALDYAHTRGIVHRDIKPSNIMIVESDLMSDRATAKVVDFGIARFLDGDAAALTTTGEIFGTPYYMSPEQCSGTKVDARSDQYSLACSLFEALTGAPPFVSQSPLTTMMMQRNDRAPRLSEVSLNGHFPESLEQLLARALEKEPDQRFPRLEEFARELIRVEQEIQGLRAPTVPSKVVASPATKAAGARQLPVGTVLAAVVILAAGFGIGISMPLLTSMQKKAALAGQETNATTESGATTNSAGSSQPTSSQTPAEVSQTKAELPSPQLAPFALIKNLPNGRKCKLFNFPKFSLGYIGKSKETMQKAMGAVMFESDEPLWLIPSWELGTNPHLFYQFGPNDLFALTCKHTGSIDDGTLLYINHLTCLRELDVEDTNVTAASLQNIDRLPNLKNLNLTALENVTGDDIAKLECLKRLEDLHCDAIPNGSAIVKALGKSSKILNLALGATGLNDDDLSAIAQFKNLQTLKISSNGRITEKGVAKLSSLQKLRKLVMEDMGPEPIMVDLSGLRDLQCLQISHVTPEMAAKWKALLPPGCKLQTDIRGVEDTGYEKYKDYKPVSK